MLCAYGCGQESKFLLKNRKECCSKSQNQCPKIRKVNSTKIQALYDQGLRADVKPNLGKKVWNSGKKFKIYSEEEMFREGTRFDGVLLKYHAVEVYHYFEYLCSECGIVDWNQKKLVLEIDHINGARTDNRRENLRLLCPNCHSQTPTFRGRGKRPVVVTDEQIRSTIPVAKNITQVIHKLGLSIQGHNYRRIRKLMDEENLDFPASIGELVQPTGLGPVPSGVSVRFRVGAPSLTPVAQRSRADGS